MLIIMNEKAKHSEKIENNGVNNELSTQES